MIKRSVLALFIVLLFSSNRGGAQEVNIISGNQLNQPVQTAVPDTFPLLDLEETELDKIPDLRAQFEKLNSSYSSPATPSENLLRFLKKDEIELSPEAQYWVNWVRDPSTDVVKTHVIKKATYEPELIKIESDPNAFSDVDAPVKFIPERRYWTSKFESTMQFSQNYISPNWSAGGDPNFNMNARQYFKYDYNKDKVQVTNELEFKLNMNTLPDKTDSIHSYKINDQILRLHTLYLLI